MNVGEHTPHGLSVFSNPQLLSCRERYDHNDALDDPAS